MAGVETVRVPAGRFTMGSDDPNGYAEDGEAPARLVHLGEFDIDQTAVTVDAFAEFVSATGFETEAETHGWSFVFGGLLPDDFEPTRGVEASPWWRQVFGANWSHPEGPHSVVADQGDHPVVHVSWGDAEAYCAWANRRLPTEAEWECAARGGVEGARFPWGDELEPGGTHRMNVWQGSFPDNNTLDDGHLGTAPVRTFPVNGLGLYEMTGNVWEWCSDWFDADFHRTATRTDPVGPGSGEARVMKGGSYLCHDSYCHRYRVAARSGNPPNASAGHLGFRTAGPT